MNERKRIIAFGELLMRLDPKRSERFVQAGEFTVRYTGAEANAGVSLVNYGMEAYAVSRVPAGEIGQACINYLRRFGIDTSFVARGGERLGILFVETGAAQRGSKVIYDRSHSAIRDASPEEFDWERICAGKHWFHFSGTAPALGSNVVRVLKEGLAEAKRAGITVSCDLNYRSKLWSPDEAREVMTGLMQYVDVLIGNEEDTEKVFGIGAEGSNVDTGRVPAESYVEVARKLAAAFDFSHVATTLRESHSASSNGWSGVLFHGDAAYISRRYDITPIVDRVGGGDAFSGGLIYALLSAMEGQQAVEFAVASSCLKHSIPGDFCLASIEEVEALAAGEASGRVKR